MNDRFKFRAKRIDNNKFVYGYLCFIYIDNEKHCKIYSPDDAMSYDCYTETLGQCIGLKDRNGKLIYEGDWIKDRDGYIAYIVWFNGAWWLKSEPSQAMDRENEETYAEFEVIGNIHENKDLLK